MNPEVESEKISPKDSGLSKLGEINLLSLKSDVHSDRARLPKAVPNEFPSAEAFADILNSDVKSDIKSEPQGLTKYLAGLPSFEDISHSVNRLGRDIYQGTKQNIDSTLASWMRVSPEDASQLLANHNLKGSFTSQCMHQLQTQGFVRVGVIDDGNSSHAKNTISRLLASVPDNLAGKVQVVLYDVSKGKEKAFDDALQDARKKEIVALSVSGGLESLNLRQLAQSVGAEDINSGNRDQAFNQALKHFDSSTRRQMQNVKEASRIIPVVTPIWNDGNTTPAALAGNVIVTSLKGDTRATRSGLPDYYLEPLPKNQFSSQGPPRVIGAMLGTIGTR